MPQKFNHAGPSVELEGMGEKKPTKLGTCGLLCTVALFENMVAR